MNKRNKILLAVVVGLLAVFVGMKFLKPFRLGSGQGTAWFSSSENLMGSSSQFGRLATTTVFSDSVSTDGYRAAVDQLIETSKLDTVFLNVMGRGVTATSTIFIRQMGSQDGTNFFDIATSTLERVTPTTTVGNAPLVATWDPSVATSSVSIPFPTYGYKFTRFLIWGEEISTNSGEGTFAWIQAIKPEPLTR